MPLKAEGSTPGELSKYNARAMKLTRFLLRAFGSAFPLSGVMWMLHCSSTVVGPNPNVNKPDAATVLPMIGPCDAVVREFPTLASPHVAVGTEVMYSSNPPSSGPHYPVWAAFRAYDAPVDRRYYVHDMEHGGVVFLYKCVGACPDIARGLQSAIDAMPLDNQCTAPLRVRAVLTPDPLLDTPVAIAAWGATYTAKCVDLPSIAKFVSEHYARGPENFCADGQPTF
jgi:Protein of unknown function (DUF3105)